MGRFLGSLGRMRAGACAVRLDTAVGHLEMDHCWCLLCRTMWLLATSGLVLLALWLTGQLGPSTTKRDEVPEEQAGFSCIKRVSLCSCCTRAWARGLRSC